MNLRQEKSTSEHQQRNELVAFNRYYHMFDKGELRLLVKEAAAEIGIEEQAETDRRRGLLRFGYRKNLFRIRSR